jgi:hypothetical protein
MNYIKSYPITPKVYITSLNLNFHLLMTRHKILGQAKADVLEKKAPATGGYARDNTLEANKDIIAPHFLYHCWGYPCHQENHHFEALWGQYEGVELRRNNQQLKYGWDSNV